MGNLTNLSAAIKTVLQGVVIGGEGFKDIREYPSLEFTGYPAATIAPSDNDSDYATTVENLRTYIFYVDVFYPVEDPTSSDGYANAFEQMRKLVDVTLDAFDMSNTLNNACQMLTPAPANWTVVETESSVNLSARITLNCKATVYTNNG